MYRCPHCLRLLDEGESCPDHPDAAPEHVPAPTEA